MTEQRLARKIGLPLLVLYGLGTILGAGIYVLIGEVALSAGALAPLSFLVAAIIAWVTAMSYSQLVVLFPRSAGEAVYVEKGFSLHWLSALVGLLIILTGVVSAATLSNGFIGYLNLFITVPNNLGMIVVLVFLCALAAWGISESLAAAAVLTLIEVVGLLIVVVFCGDALLVSPAKIGGLFVPTSFAAFTGVLSGAFIAFYAFIGFEDMVNVVEEVKEPSKIMPKAILLVIVVSTFLYVLVALIAILSLPLAQLSASDAPLALMLESRSKTASKLIGGISVFAILNGVLIQIIMASRVLYGIAYKKYIPQVFGRVHPKTKTPIYATIAISILVVLFALWFPLVTLAKITSFVILVIFTLVNLALWRVSLQSEYENKITQRQYPRIGALLCVLLLISQLL
jgi:APA family basic amino acid/polyamine antiporter